MITITITNYLFRQNRTGKNNKGNINNTYKKTLQHVLVYQRIAVLQRLMFIEVCVSYFVVYQCIHYYNNLNDSCILKFLCCFFNQVRPDTFCHLNLHYVTHDTCLRYICA